MKILITGHRGFVGSAFVKRLETHDLTLIDIKDGNDAVDFFAKDDTRFDLVIHCAATVGGRKTIDLAPYKLFNNFVLDSMLLQWCLKTNPKQVVYFSSSAAYPNKLQVPELKHRLKEADIDLNSVQNPDPSVYGWSKLTGEMLISYSGIENIHIFRPFSGYSEDQDLDYPFPSFINRARQKLDPFEIWGDGEQVRDWIHIDDIVEMVLVTVASTAGRQAWNICNGRATSFNELAQYVANEAGYSPQLDHRLDAPVGVQYRVGDPTKSHIIYVPQISLEEGIWRAMR